MKALLFIVMIAASAAAYANEIEKRTLDGAIRVYEERFVFQTISDQLVHVRAKCSYRKLGNGPVKVSLDRGTSLKNNSTLIVDHSGKRSRCKVSSIDVI